MKELVYELSTKMPREALDHLLRQIDTWFNKSDVEKSGCSTYKIVVHKVRQECDCFYPDTYCDYQQSRMCMKQSHNKDTHRCPKEIEDD